MSPTTKRRGSLLCTGTEVNIQKRFHRYPSEELVSPRFRHLHTQTVRQTDRQNRTPNRPSESFLNVGLSLTDRYDDREGEKDLCAHVHRLTSDSCSTGKAEVLGRSVDNRIVGTPSKVATHPSPRVYDYRSQEWTDFLSSTGNQWTSFVSPFRAPVQSQGT